MSKIKLNTPSSLEDFSVAAALSEAEAFLKDKGLPYRRQADGTLLAEGDIDLSGRGLTALPDLSPVVLTGHFLCHHNKLANLRGAPRAVESFWCHNNELTSLDGAPKKIAHHFFCGSNLLDSLKGGPLFLTGSYHCSGNRLPDLDGGPQQVGQTFYCGDNKLSSLEGAPLVKTIASDFGNFSCWEEIPEPLRVSGATREREAQEMEEKRARHLAAAIQSATVLKEPVAVSKPFRFKTNRTAI